MILPTCAAFLISTAIGFWIVSLFWPGSSPFTRDFWLKLTLAFGVGQGVTSCLFFGWLTVVGRIGRELIFFELGLLALLMVVLFLRKNPPPLPRPRAEIQTSQFGRWIKLVFVCVLFATTVGMTATFLANPHGSWDAWAIYGLRARFLMRGGDLQSSTFSNLIQWSHPDYPLLLPASTARLWVYAGRESPVLQSVTSSIFTFATAGLLVQSLSRLRSESQGFLAGLLLLISYSFVLIGSSGVADVPLAYYFTAAIVLPVVFDQSDRVVILSGLFAGFGAWTKNEGLVFLFIILVVQVLFSLRRRKREGYRQLALMIVGATPVLLVVAYFKLVFAPPSEIVTAWFSPTLMTKLADPSRYIFILKTATARLFTRTQRLDISYLLLFYAICMGFSIKRRFDIFRLTLVLVLMLTSYFWVYLTTPHELTFHVTESINRLYLQLYPLLLFIYFLLLPTPEEALSGRRLERSELQGS